MPHSHHSHSGQFCKHATGQLADVVIEAIKQGFRVYGLTEHVPRYRDLDLYPEEIEHSVDVLAKQFDNFLDEAHRLKSAYASRITLLVGLETEFITETDLEHLHALLEKHKGRIDYLVGSVHHVNGIPIDFDQATYEKSLKSLTSNESSQADMERFLGSYFDAQYEVMCRFHPEVIGHFDLCRLYNPLIRLRDYREVWEKVKRNLRCGIDYGAVFEVNAAALRKGWTSAYPAADVIQLILEHGGKFVLSDDSHGPHAVGLNYNRMASYLMSVGVHKLHYLNPTDTPNFAGRHVRVVEADGDWWDDLFWRDRSLITPLLD